MDFKVEQDKNLFVSVVSCSEKKCTMAAITANQFRHSVSGVSSASCSHSLSPVAVTKTESTGFETSTQLQIVAFRCRI